MNLVIIIVGTIAAIAGISIATWTLIDTNKRIKK